MIHSPLTVPFRPGYRNISGDANGTVLSVGTSENDQFDIKPFSVPVIQTQQSPVLPANPLPFSIPFTPNPLLNHQFLKLGVSNSSLSGSSSLSSSLISLHSTSNGCVNNQPTSSFSPLPNCANTRDSRWLKLPLCPSLANLSVLNSPEKPFKDASIPGESVDAQVNEHPKSDQSSSQSEQCSEFHCSLLGPSCPHAHPSATVRVEAEHVTVCYDFIKRKHCKYVNCKYYHPPPHQIEAIIKRGDDQRKLLESQQRSLEHKVTNFMAMQSLPQSNSNGLPPFASVAGACNSNLRWPSTSLLPPNMLGSMYATYLPNTGHVLPTALSPANVIPSSSPDAGPLNTSALLAAAAVLQQQHGASISNMISSTSNPNSIISRSFSGYKNSAVMNELCSDVTTTPEPWLPTKRSNMNADCSSSASAGTNLPSETNHLCYDNKYNCDTSHQNFDLNNSTFSDTTNSVSHCVSGTGLNPTHSCNSISDANMSQVQSETSSILAPMNMNFYSLPFSQSPNTSYLPPQFLYPSVFSGPTMPETSCSMTPVAAAMALNNILAHQQQQLQHNQLLRLSLPTVSSSALHGSTLYQPYGPLNLPQTAALVASQHQYPDLRTANAINPAIQQQQQAFLLSAFLRAQQAQLIAAQVATGTAPGYLSTNGSPHVMLEPTCPVPGTFTGLSATNPCSLNPMTNVAYINEKGHLLETLPICRDFKAGKCRRNTDCRYVHLVDENVEVNQGRVIVCRDAAKGRCTRIPCKYYHIPLFAISANRSMALNSALANAVNVSSVTNNGNQ